MHFPIDRTVHTTAFDKPVVDHWLERKIAQTAAGSTEKECNDSVNEMIIYICIHHSHAFVTKICKRSLRNILT